MNGEIKSRLNLGNVWCHLVQSDLSSSLLSKKKKKKLEIEKYKTWYSH